MTYHLRTSISPYENYSQLTWVHNPDSPWQSARIFVYIKTWIHTEILAAVLMLLDICH